MIHYNKTQYGKIIIITLVLIIIGVLTFSIVKNDSEIPLSVCITVSGIIAIALALFSKLNISINDTKIEAKFGFGLIKQRFLISELKHATIEEFKVPAWYGIGLRLTPKGTLFNVKFGPAILIKSPNKTFFVGTDDFNTINKILNDLKEKSS